MKTIHFLFKLLMITLLCSCSSDDEVVEPVKKESIRIKAIELYAKKIPDTEGDALEVYGTITAKLILNDSSNEQILWQKSREYYQSLGYANISSEEFEHVFTLTEEEIKNGALIEVKANMWDKDPDGNPDDFLGENIERFEASWATLLANDNNPTGKVITLDRFEGIEFLVFFTIEHIREE